jgi:hypothetical protein
LRLIPRMIAARSRSNLSRAAAQAIGLKVPGSS